MEMTEFMMYVMTLFSDADKMLKMKNSDYANGTDVFKNFTETSEIVRAMGLDLRKREHIALYEIVKKVNRLVNLGDSKPKNESVRDSCLDIINFAVLYYGMMSEVEK